MPAAAAALSRATRDPLDTTIPALERSYKETGSPRSLKYAVGDVVTVRDDLDVTRNGRIILYEDNETPDIHLRMLDDQSVLIVSPDQITGRMEREDHLLHSGSWKGLGLPSLSSSRRPSSPGFRRFSLRHSIDSRQSLEVRQTQSKASEDTLVESPAATVAMSTDPRSPSKQRRRSIKDSLIAVASNGVSGSNGSGTPASLAIDPSAVVLPTLERENSRSDSTLARPPRLRSRRPSLTEMNLIEGKPVPVSYEEDEDIIMVDIQTLFNDHDPSNGNCFNKFQGLRDMKYWHSRTNLGATTHRYNSLNAPLRLIHPTGNLRRRLVHIVDSRWFSNLVLAAIFANAVCLAMDIPSTEENDSIQTFLLIAEYVFLAIFTIEAVMKIGAMGFIMHADSYLRESDETSYVLRTSLNWWNIIDFAIVLLAWAGLHPSVSNVTVVRALRLLRPLKALHKVEGLQILIKALLSSLGPLWNIVVLLLFFMVMFAIVGVLIWEGRWHDRCFLDVADVVRTAPPETLNDTIARGIAVWTGSGDAPLDLPSDGERSLENWNLSEWILANVSHACTTTPFGAHCNANDIGTHLSATCRVGGYRRSTYVNFDNTLTAILLVFKVISLDDWPDELRIASDTVGQAAFVYFLAVTLFGSYFTMNLVLAVMCGDFAEHSAAIREAKRLERELIEFNEKFKHTYRVYNVSCATIHFTFMRLAIAVYGAGVPSAEYEVAEGCTKEDMDYVRTQGVLGAIRRKSLKSSGSPSCEPTRRPICPPPLPPADPGGGSSHTSDLRTISHAALSPSSSGSPDAVVAYREHSTLPDQNEESEQASPATIPYGGAYDSDNEPPSPPAPPPAPNPLTRGERSPQMALLNTTSNFPTSSSNTTLPATHSTIHADHCLNGDSSYDRSQDYDDCIALQQHLQQLNDQIGFDRGRNGLGHGRNHNQDRKIVIDERLYTPKPSIPDDEENDEDDEDDGEEVDLGEEEEEEEEEEEMEEDDGEDEETDPVEVKWYNQYSPAVKRFVQWKRFNQFVVFVIAFNVLVMTLDHHGISRDFERFIEVTSFVCNLVFILEMLLKFVGLSIGMYFADPWNRFDCLLVLVSLPEMFTSLRSSQQSGSSGVTALRALRAFRVTRLLRRYKSLQHVVTTIMRSLSSAVYLCLIMLLFIFIYTILGVQLFAASFPRHERNNFSSLWNSAITVFVIITGEGWATMMSTAMDHTSPAAAMYFVTLFSLGNYIFMNLFIAILIDNFADMHNQELEARKRRREERKRREKTDQLLDEVLAASPRGPSPEEASEQTYQNPRRHTMAVPRSQQNEYAEIRGRSQSAPSMKKIFTTPPGKAIFDSSSGQSIPPPRSHSPKLVPASSALPRGDSGRSSLTPKYLDSPRKSRRSTFRDGSIRSMKRTGWGSLSAEVYNADSLALSGYRLDSPRGRRAKMCLSPSPVSPRLFHSTPGIDVARYGSFNHSVHSMRGTTHNMSQRFSFAATMPNGPPQRFPSFAASTVPTVAPLKTGVLELGFTDFKDARPKATRPKLRIQTEKSLNLFTLDNKFRASLIKVVHHPAFDYIILFIISLNTVTMALEGRWTRNQSSSFRTFLEVSDIVFVCLFTVEAMMKIVVYGLIGKAPQKRGPPQFTESVVGSTQPPRQLVEGSEGPPGSCASLMDGSLSPGTPRPNMNRRQSTRLGGMSSAMGLVPHFDRTKQNLQIAKINDGASEDEEGQGDDNLSMGYASGIGPEECLQKTEERRMWVDEEMEMRPYLRNTWNRVDFFVCITSILGLIIPIMKIFRSLRTLRLIIRNRNIKVVVRALFKALPAIANVLAVITFIFIVFSILGVQLFKGRMWYCTDPLIELRENCTGQYFPPACSGFLSSSECPDHTCTWEEGRCVSTYQYTDIYGDPVYNTSAGLEREWVNSRFNFDNTGEAFLALFQVSLGESWAEIMWLAVDARSTEHSIIRSHNTNPIYTLFFITFMVTGNFFALNLFVGLLIDQFTMQRRQLDGSAFLLPEQQEWVKSHKTLCRIRLQQRPVKPCNPLRACVFRVVSARWFDNAVLVAICANVIFVSLRHWREPSTLTKIQTYANYCFISLFATEAVMKIVAWGTMYFYDKWNNFDFALVLLSIGGLVVGNTSVQIFRIFRIARILRLIKQARGLAVLFGTLFYALPSLMNIGLLLLCTYFNFAVLGIEIFGGVRRSEYLDKWLNFEHMGNAIIALYTASSTEKWNDIMEGTTLSQPGCEEQGDCGASRGAAIAFFMTFMVSGSLITVNLFITVVLENFGEQKNSDDTEDLYYMLEVFKDRWSMRDPEATGWLHITEFLDIMRELPPPIGIRNPLSNGEMMHHLRFLSIPVSSDGLLRYSDALFTIARKLFGIGDEQMRHLAKYTGKGLECDKFTVYHLFAAIRIQGRWRNHVRQARIFWAPGGPWVASTASAAALVAVMLAVMDEDLESRLGGTVVSAFDLTDTDTIPGDTPSARLMHHTSPVTSPDESSPFILNNTWENRPPVLRMEELNSGANASDSTLIPEAPHCTEASISQQDPHSATTPLTTDGAYNRSVSGQRSPFFHSSKTYQASPLKSDGEVRTPNPLEMDFTMRSPDATFIVAAPPQSPLSLASPEMERGSPVLQDPFYSARQAASSPSDSLPHPCIDVGRLTPSPPHSDA